MKEVFFDHDAHVDDLLVLMMLQCAEVDLIGTAVCPGDCYKDPGLRATQRFLDFFGNKNIPSAAGDDEGTNPFPALWRADSEILAKLPELGDSQATSIGRTSSAAELIVSALSNAAAPVSIVITGPPTNLAAALAAKPSIKE
jgi:purine nucleosidase